MPMMRAVVSTRPAMLPRRGLVRPQAQGCLLYTSGLGGIVTVTGGIGEGTGPERLVRILREAGLAETVAVGTAEIAVGCLIPFAVETGKGRLAVFPEVAAAFVPGGQAIGAAAFVAPALGGVFPCLLYTSRCV